MHISKPFIAYFLFFYAQTVFSRAQEITPAGGFVTKNKDSVSASWGGFVASASLADDGSAGASAGGNGLAAGAGYGAGGAGAGAGVHGNGAAFAGNYGNGGSPVYGQDAGAGGGFFDRIFAVSTRHAPHARISG